MSQGFPRSRRIAEQIQRDLAELIRTEIKDPGLQHGLTTITDVEVSADHAHAKVFFTSLSDKADLEDIAAALRRASGFLRTQLAHRLKLRTVPQLEFKYDASVERGVRLSRLIDEAVGTQPKPQSDD